jgi:hypothetical protein
MFKSEYVNEYCIEKKIETIINLFKIFFGNGKNQNIRMPVNDQRNPLSKIGGN